MSVRNTKTPHVRTLQQAVQPTPTPPIVQTPPAATPSHAPPHQTQSRRSSRRAVRVAEQARHQAEACARLASLPVQHEHAAGIDAGDASHWVCVDATPDGSDTVLEFPAHTPGLRQLVDWLRHCGVTTVAVEATGVYSHVLFLTLLEAGFTVVMTAAQFTRQIKGRPTQSRTGKVILMAGRAYNEA
jgi:Transposase